LVKTERFSSQRGDGTRNRGARHGRETCLGHATLVQWSHEQRSVAHSSGPRHARRGYGEVLLLLLTSIDERSSDPRVHYGRKRSRVPPESL